MAKKQIDIPDVNVRAMLEFIIDALAALVAGLIALKLAAGESAPYVGQLFALIVAIAAVAIVYKLMRAHRLLKPRKPREPEE